MMTASDGVWGHIQPWAPLVFKDDGPWQRGGFANSVCTRRDDGSSRREVRGDLELCFRTLWRAQAGEELGTQEPWSL